MPKLPNPCIDVCKFRLDGRCIGCAMTKKEKKGFKKLDGAKARAKQIDALLREQRRIGDRFRGWAKIYRRKCAKKGVEPPADLPAVAR
jgi:uncharacterized protein